MQMYALFLLICIYEGYTKRPTKQSRKRLENAKWTSKRPSLTMEDQNLSYFDAEAYTSDSQGIAIFINEALQSNDANHIANALGIAARGRGIKEVALLSNLSEYQLEQSLNQEGNPTLDTLIKTLKALNLKIAVEPIC